MSRPENAFYNLFLGTFNEISENFNFNLSKKRKD